MVSGTDEISPSQSGWIEAFRLCRALALVALGATLHLHLPAFAPANSPRVAPLSVASSAVQAAEREIVVNQALVFAPAAKPLDVPRLAPRDVPRVPVTGLLAKVTAPAPPTRPASVAAPVERRPSPTIVPTPTAPSALSEPNAASRPDGFLESNLARPLADDLPRLALTPVAAPRRSSEEELVRQLIDRYAVALERLDVGAAQAAWPTVDGKALKRAFGQLASQRLTFQSCGITISGSTANARCRGRATYQPRVGSGPVQLASREWTFDFSKQDTDWRIVNTFVR
jgi:hypothetical protein